jgi:hypothetical protein
MAADAVLLVRNQGRMSNPQDYAVVAAINRYPGWQGRDLDGSGNDLADFGEWLMSPTGGDLPPDAGPDFGAWLADPARGPLCASSPQQRVQFFASPPPGTAMTLDDAKPMTRAIEDALQAFHVRGRTSSHQNGGSWRVGRRLYIYLAGHGFAPDRYDSGFFMADASEDNPGLHILARSYADYFVERHIFDEVVLIMDCCREDNTTIAPRRLTFNRSKAVRPPDLPIKPLAMFATVFAQNAREIAQDANGKPRGIFTQTLMRGLRGDARSGNVVTASSLEKWVLNSMPNTQLPPEFDLDRRPGSDMVLCMLPAAQVNLRLRVQNADAAVQVTLDGGPGHRTGIVGQRAGDTWAFTLEPGIYAARVSGRSGITIIEEHRLGGPVVDL